MEQTPQEAQEKSASPSMCRTPSIFREERHCRDGEKRLTKRERFWLRQGTGGRSKRRWEIDDLLSVKRCLFPKENKHDCSNGEESDESGYSYDWTNSDTSEKDTDDDISDSEEGHEFREKRFFGNTPEEDQTQDYLEPRDNSPKDLPECEIPNDNEYLTGIKLHCDDERPMMTIHYPYADHCPDDVIVASEVEIAFCE